MNLSKLSGILLLATSSCIAAELEAPRSTPMPGAAASLIDDAEMRNYVTSALDGDEMAAVALTMHHCISDGDECVYWARIGAENGDTGSMFNLGRLLLRTESKKSQRRGLFWLKKVLELEGTGFHAYDLLIPAIEEAEAKMKLGSEEKGTDLLFPHVR